MDEFNVTEHLETQRWLINNGFINDFHKDTLYLYGTLVHKDVKAVDATIDVNDKRITYTIYVPKSLIHKIHKADRLSSDTSIISLWRYKRLLKREGDLNFKRVIVRFVHDYLGSNWSVHVLIKDFREYVDAPNDAEGAPS